MANERYTRTNQKLYFRRRCPGFLAQGGGGGEP